ncbi:MAG: SH3 domain-containing protein [Clostridia bacterium]
MKQFLKQHQAEVAFSLFSALGLWLLWGCAHVSFAECETRTVYVMASELNGRAEASLKATVEARFYRGDELEALRYQLGWVEVVGGETGTVWCKAEHLSEYAVEAEYANKSGGRVFIHAELGDDSKDGKRAVECGKRVTVTRVLYGYGYMGKGWIDLSFMELEDDAE